jgi:mannitol-1-phosphate/altronate dehydrogenase
MNDLSKVMNAATGVRPTPELPPVSSTSFALSNSTLHLVPPAVKKPTYDRSALKAGIVHFGPGAFARAHLFDYVEDLVEQGRHDLGIIAVCPRKPEIRDLLKPQDNLYTIRAGSHGERSDRIIGCVKDTIFAGDDRKGVVELIAAPDTQYVTMAVTQKGYHFDNNNQLDLKSQDIQKSLANADEPTAVVAYIVEAMALRMARGLPGITVISCDNVVNNGTNLKGTLLAYANERAKARNNGVLDEEGKQLTHWIEENVPCPNTMVDRITPAYEPAHTKLLEAHHNIHDKAPIKTEASKSFVIDGAFADRLPGLDQVGAKYDNHVSLYVRAKNRLLNGAHMVMGLVGRLSGYTYAHEVMADPDLKKFVVGVTDEMIGTLEGTDDLNLVAYRDSLLERFSNPYMEDKLQRLARNGESKLNRLTDPISELRGDLQQYPHLMTALAGWVAYLKNADASPDPKQAGAFPIEDPVSYANGYVAKAKELNGHIAPFLALEKVWGILREREGFHEAMQAGWEKVGVVDDPAVKRTLSLDFRPQ